MCRVRFYQRYLTKRKKLNWYLDRNLAEKLDDCSIRLIFQPNGVGHVNPDEEYYLEDRDNICVVCGTSSDLTLHHVGMNLLEWVLIP
jgi:hypothetical protein